MFATRDPASSAALMRAPDQVAGRFGRSTLRPLATGLARDWGTQAGRLSLRYTAQASEILQATAM